MHITHILQNAGAFGLNWADYAPDERAYCDQVASNADIFMPVAQLRRLKAKITPKILSHLYNWASNYGNAYQSQVVLLHHRYYLIKVISLFGLSYVAKPMAARALDDAIDLDQYPIIYDIARILSRYASFSGDEHLTERYDDIAQMAHDSIGDEMDMERLYNRLTAKIRKRQGLSPDDISDMASAIDDIEEARTLSAHMTPRYHYLRYKMLYILHMYNADAENALDMCMNGYDYFAELHYDHSEACLDFANSAIDCMQMLNRYEDAAQWIDKAQKHCSNNTTHAYNLKEMRLRCHISNKEPIEALRLYKYMSADPEYLRLMPDYLQERLYIYRVYIAILDRVEIKVDRYIDDILLSKDRQAMNIAVLVAHLSYLYATRQYGELLDMETRVRTYMSRYVDEERDKAMINYVFLQAKKSYLMGYAKKHEEVLYTLQHSTPTAHELLNYNQLITLL